MMMVSIHHNIKCEAGSTLTNFVFEFFEIYCQIKHHNEIPFRHFTQISTETPRISFDLLKF